MTALSDRQLARVECLKAAREVLVARGAFNTSAPDALDVVSLARYVETGVDPWGKPGDAS